MILAASGSVVPRRLALAAGLAYGFTFEHPFHLEARRLSKFLLQASVVGLGFGMDLQFRFCKPAAPDSFTPRSASLLATNVLAGRSANCCGCTQGTSFLITTGTAICGGSAIAALSLITNASATKRSAASPPRRCVLC